MNKRSIRSNLREARQELDEILSERDSETMSEEDFCVFMQHAYFHLNFAWNTRHSPDEKVVKMTQRDFTRWGKFPSGKVWKRFHRTTGSTIRTKRRDRQP